MTDPIRNAAVRLAQFGAQSPFGTGSSPEAIGGQSFGNVLKQALGKVSEAQETAQDTVGAFLRGEPVELHQVMAASEEAGIALEMLIEIRNRFADAYRTVINMQS